MYVTITEVGLINSYTGFKIHPEMLILFLELQIREEISFWN